MMAKIFVSFNIVNPSNCFLVAREKDDPLSEVYRSDVLTTPHTQRNITIDDLNPVMHIVQLWTTTDNVNLDALIGSCDIDASIANELTFGYIQFVVGRGNLEPEYDPAPWQGQYANPDLDGKTYLVFKEGVGPLKWGIDIQTIEGGGFEFINGQEFGDEEGYTVQYSNISSSSSSSSGRSYPADIIEITEDTEFGSEHYNNLLEVNGDVEGGIITINIASLDAVPNNTKFGINTHNGKQRYVTLQLDSGRYCQINGEQENAVYIGKAEEWTFIKKGSYLRVVSGGDSANKVGQRVFADGKQPPNTLPETGGWYPRDDYPRLVKWHIERIPSGELGTGTEDVTPNSTNKTKWILGENKFWVPNTEGLGIRATSSDSTVDAGGPRAANSNQADSVGPHNHNLTVPPIATSKTDEGVGRFVTGNDGNEPSGIVTVATANNSGTETVMKNVATNFYRYI